MSNSGMTDEQKCHFVREKMSHSKKNDGLGVKNDGFTKNVQLFENDPTQARK